MFVCLMFTSATLSDANLTLLNSWCKRTTTDHPANSQKRLQKTPPTLWHDPDHKFENKQNKKCTVNPVKDSGFNKAVAHFPLVTAAVNVTKDSSWLTLANINLL